MNRLQGYGPVAVIVWISLSIAFLVTGCAWSGREPATPGKTTFVFARSSDAVALDPAGVSDGESLYVTRQIFESLLEYKPDSTELQPGLATKWESSKDGLIWTFQLRKGVTFHDGTPFDAWAVKYNFDRWRLPNHPEHRGIFEYYRSIFGGFPGNIRDVQVVDSHTVRFVLAKPQVTFLANLAMPSFALSSPAAIKKYGAKYQEHPVGTGPFKFVNWQPGRSVKLTRNEDYWGEKAKVREVIFRVIPDNSARLKALQAGQVDAAIDINPGDVRVIEEDPNLQLLLRPSMNIGYLAINNEKAPFQDVKVRQALNYAINKDALIAAYYGGLAKPAKNPLPPSIWGYNDEVEEYPYNPAKAKALLAEAGYPNGFRTRLWVMPIARPYMPRPREIAQAIREDLVRVGIEVEMVSYDWATYISKGREGEHELYLVGWTGDNGDPDNFLFMLLDKSNAVRGAATNLAFYKNDRVHDLLAKAQEETDQDRRAALYRKAQVYIREDAPWVPLVHTTPPVAARKAVQQWLPHATGTEPFNNLIIEG